MTISKKIYRCRKANGLSQEELAGLLGVSRQSVSKWETGDALPEIGKLLPMAKSFGVTTDWLLDEGKEYPYQPPVPFVPDMNKGESTKRTTVFYQKYGWIIGAVMIVYGIFLSHLHSILSCGHPTAGCFHADLCEEKTAFHPSISNRQNHWIYAEIYSKEIGTALQRLPVPKTTPAVRRRCFLGPLRPSVGPLIA